MQSFQLLGSYWLLLTVFETLKSVRLHQLMVLNPTTTKNSQYPSSDQFLDNVVLVDILSPFMSICAQ
jgi:hypothetical protein